MPALCWATPASSGGRMTRRVKANVFRPNARAGIYVYPAEEARAQLFFDLDHNKLDAVRAVTMGPLPT